MSKAILIVIFQLSLIFNMAITAQDEAKKLDAKVKEAVTYLQLNEEPTGMFLYGNELYLAIRDERNISKIDLTAETPVLEKVVDNLDTPIGLAIKDDILYFASYTENIIYSVDLKDKVKKPKAFLTDIEGPANIFIDGDNFYFIQQPINKISLTKLNSKPSITDIAKDYDFLKPTSIIKHKNYLYFIETYGSKVSRLDLEKPNAKVEVYLEGLKGPYLGSKYRDTLYIAELYGNQIVEVDLGSKSPKAKTLVEGLQGPFGVVRKDSALYIMEHFGKKILKFEL